MGGERAFSAEGERRYFLAPPETASEAAPSPVDRTDARGLFRRSVSASGSWRAPALLHLISEELAKDGARGAAFLCLPVFMAAGALAYFAISWEPGAPVLLAVIAPLIAAVFLFQARPVLLHASGALLAFAIGAGAAKLETWRAETPVLGSEVTTRLTGRVAQIEHQANGRVRLVLDVLATERPKLRYAPERVRLTAREVPADLRPGDGISSLARLMPPSGPVRPGSYDFSFASYFSGIGAIGFFMTGPERARADGGETVLSRPARWLETARLALAERIRMHVSGAEGAVAVAMIVGFRPGIPEEVNEWLRRSGLAHILSISGLHMALVAVTVMFMLRAGAALFPGFASSVPVKKYAAAAALAFCTLYLFISGADVAAQRSYIMLAVMLAALLFDRAALTMRNVAIAALIIIVLSPHEVAGPSFQMSFAATAALVAGYAAWSEWQRGRPARAPATPSLAGRAARMAAGFALGLAATSLIAGTATALYGIWHFQRATPLALPANLVAMPIVSVAAMPMAVLSILAMPFGLDGFFLKIMGHAIAAVIAVAKWFSDRSPIDAVGLIPLPAVLALTVALAILVVSTTRLRLLALPFILPGAVLLMTRDLPDVLVSEDARLVGIRGAGGAVAVNRARPNGFTIEDWARALDAETILKPENGKGESAGPSDRFSCAGGLCLARHESGAVVAHAESADAAGKACSATLIVIDDAKARDLCGGNGPVVLTKRELARKGSVAVRFRPDGSGIRAEASFAIDEPWRPWHEHRAFSRAARGLPPYRRSDGPSAGGTPVRPDITSLQGG